MLNFDYMAPELISSVIRSMKIPEKHVICGVKYIPELTCEGCAYDLNNGDTNVMCIGCARKAPDRYMSKVVE